MLLIPFHPNVATNMLRHCCDRCALTRLERHKYCVARSRERSFLCRFALLFSDTIFTTPTFPPSSRLACDAPPGRSKRELWTWKPLSEVWPSNSRRFIQVASLIRRKIFYLHTFFLANKSVAFCVTVLPRLFMCWRVLAAKKEV